MGYIFVKHHTPITFAGMIDCIGNDGRLFPIAAASFALGFYHCDDLALLPCQSTCNIYLN